MKKMTACLSAALLLGLLVGPAALAATPAEPGTQPADPVLSPTEPDTPPTNPQLPDPNDPDSPEEITIEEDGVPKTYIKVWDPEEEEFIYILDDEVPLANRNSPQTGVDGQDGTALMALMATAFGVGGAAVLRKTKKSGC